MSNERVCFRHASCRIALKARLKVWPTATYPRAFVTVTLGAIGVLCACVYVPLSVWALWWLLTQTGPW